MKGKVFIGWCGDATLADEVKNKLKAVDFEGIRGGQTRADNYMYLGQAILTEIDGCNQAIFIFQKRKDGQISPNALFELGYALSRLEKNKIHVFYVDISENDPSIPADLKGIWAEYLYNIESNQIDEKVIESFLANQRKALFGNKMKIINNYYETRSAFETYVERPFCSEQELPQHVLFFSQAAFMFKDVQEGFQHLENLVKKLQFVGPELDQAFNFSLAYLNFFSNLSSQGEDCIYLDFIPFRTAREAFNDVLEEIESWPESDFKLWLEILALESLNYIHILRAASPEAKTEERDRHYDESISLAFRTLEKCDALIQRNKTGGEPVDEQCIAIYRAYMYRNLSTAYLKKGTPDTQTAKKYLKLSYRERKKLLTYFKKQPISSRIIETIEMEYFLAISELLEYPEDRDSLDENIISCKDYLCRIKGLHIETSLFINKIERNLKRAEARS